MKTVTKLVGIIAFVAIIGFAMVACDDGSEKNEVSSLNGTWGLTQGDMSIEYKFNNGSFGISMNNAPVERGTYTTRGNKLTINISHVYGQSYMTEMMRIELQAKWYTVTEFFNALKNELDLSDEEWAEMEPMIQQSLSNGTVYTYSISGNTLKLTINLSQAGQTGTQTVTLTKK
jgi:hypothetical protein